MFPAQFDYRRADSVAEAIDLLAGSGDRDVRPLAGGQGVVRDAKAGEVNPDALVDVSGIDELAGIEADGDESSDGIVTVGALATHADLASSALLENRTPVLAAAAEQVADRQVRNRGTIGGNLAEADPAADLPAAVLAAGGTLHLRGTEGERAVPATEFFRGAGETALAGDELVTAVEVPGHSAGAYVKKDHPATGYAMVGVAAVVGVESGTATDVRVAANGVMEHAVRLETVEESLTGIDVHADADEGPDLAEASARASESLDADRQVGDAHASAEFRTGVLGAYVERALERALDDASDVSANDGSADDGRADDGGDPA